LMNYRNRSYNPNWGRFVSEDPIGLAGGINVYAYANGNPVNYKDPTGLYSKVEEVNWLPPTPPTKPTALQQEAKIPTLKECIFAIMCYFGGEGPPPPPPKPEPKQIEIIINPKRK